MSATSQKNDDNQEIDLSQISKKIGDFFQSISNSIFQGILFIKKNILLLAILFVIGAGLGFYMDKQNKIFDTKIIVTPYLGSTDYLYTKIDLISSKLLEKDYKFLKSIGFDKPENINLIEIEPIIDIYTFVNNSTVTVTNAQNTQNFELIKLLSEDGDINKVIKDKVTSKNYAHHTIHIVTDGLTSEKEIVKPLLKFLNSDDYLNKVRVISYNNVVVKMKKNEHTINQLDSLINQITFNIGKSQKSANLIYNNENNQINSLFDLKNTLTTEIGNQKIDLVNLKMFIKDISTTLNIKNTKGLNGKMKLVLPFLLIFFFILFGFFRSFYRHQVAKSKI